jgi:hypothetical protein
MNPIWIRESRHFLNLDVCRDLYATKIWKSVNRLVLLFWELFGLPESESADRIESGSDPMTNSDFHTQNCIPIRPLIAHALL